MASSLAQAIATLEGYGAGHNLPTIANNPGDLSPADTGATGATPLTDSQGNKVTVFNDVSDGWTALESKLQNILSGNDPMYDPNASVQQFGNTYAGNSTYGNKLASLLGVDPSTPLASVAGGGNLSAPIYENPSTGGVANSQGQTVPANVAPGDFTLFGWNPPRVVFLVLGLVLFAAGLFAFKQTQTVISGAVKGARTIAEAS